MGGGCLVWVQWGGTRLDPLGPQQPMEQGRRGRRRWLLPARAPLTRQHPSSASSPTPSPFPAPSPLSCSPALCRPFPSRGAAAPSTHPAPTQPGLLGRWALVTRGQHGSSRARWMLPSRWGLSILGASEPAVSGAVAGTGERRGDQGDGQALTSHSHLSRCPDPRSAEAWEAAGQEQGGNVTAAPGTELKRSVRMRFSFKVVQKKTNCSMCCTGSGLGPP